MSTMNETKSTIAAALETAFAERGFTEPGVAELRDRAGVSIRTLYKHFPSRDDMILAALQRRHERYLAFLFPEPQGASLDPILERVGRWMAENAPAGCLFHNAVAAHPENDALRDLLSCHKTEIGQRLAACAGRPELRVPLLLVHEGLVQSWPLEGDRAVAAARELTNRLLSRA